ncbi:MAG: restriction endonuclease [Candidatus Riflebacteria bacterium]|nr:restriction endonuclease [Candidatus Riflebacteria bacterium]
MNYDFGGLNDKEFEILVCDLLSHDLGVQAERFKPGKDSGVDGRFFSGDGEVIIQCKHYLRTGYPGLISVLKSKEIGRVRKLNPVAYIFATSLPLSRANKAEIMLIFSPFVKSESHLLGQEALNDLLAKHPEVEKRHFKLWLASTQVLANLLNQAISGRSEFELERIKKKAARFVPTSDYIEARNFLKTWNVVILTGEPGIGKTTLAENLCLLYSSRGYEFVAIEESLSEAENVYQKGKNQIFFFDDFLGSNYLEAIEGKKDSHIVNFIDRVRGDSGKKFVLTSRTNILMLGITFSSIFSNRKLQTSELLLSITSLTPIDKAKILYNHIWFSNLNEAFIDQLYLKKRYREVVNHKNFSPRLIEFITDIDRLVGVSQEKYWHYILETFSNPRDVWDNSFKVQSNQFLRNLVVLTVYNGGEIQETALRQAFGRLGLIQEPSDFSHTDKTFNSIASLSTKSFLIRFQQNNEFHYKLFNPSISDYVLNEMKNEEQKNLDFFLALGTRKSLQQLESLLHRKIITIPSNGRHQLFVDALYGQKSLDYQVKICSMAKDIAECKAGILALLNSVTKVPQPIYFLDEFFILLEQFWPELDDVDPSFLHFFVKNSTLEENEVSSLICFIENHSLESDEILDMLKACLEDHILKEVTRQAGDEDWSGFVSFEEGNDGDPEARINDDGIFERLVEMGEKILKNYKHTIVASLPISVEDSLQSIGTSDLVSDLTRWCDPSWEDDGFKPPDFNKDIDDLFERD